MQNILNLQEPAAVPATAAAFRAKIKLIILITVMPRCCTCNYDYHHCRHRCFIVINIALPSPSYHNIVAVVVIVSFCRHQNRLCDCSLSS
jgi:hypothetical protein